MLRSTSKAAKANIHQYIIEHFDPTGYDYEAIDCTDWQDVARAIWDVWHEEKVYGQHKGFECFKDWAQGLPSILDTCYYYNRSAVKDLAVILEDEKTLTELKENYEDWYWCKEEYWESERAAEEKLTWLIYRELQQANN